MTEIKDELRPEYDLRELHPEVLFWALNGRRAMSQRKKRKPGYAERLAALWSAYRVKTPCDLVEHAMTLSGD